MRYLAVLLANLLLLPQLYVFAEERSGAIKRPNILFIAVDDLRPEIGCYGNKLVKTPSIDRIAARGIVFDRAYCQQAVCSPSRTAIMTGLRPDVTKVWDLQTHFRAAVPDAITLPEHFKTHGYHCAALGKIYHLGYEDGRSWNEPHWYPRGRSVDTDPKNWTQRITVKHDVNVSEYMQKINASAAGSGAADNKGPAYEVSTKSEEQLPDGAVAAEAVKRIAELAKQDSPFFLAVGFIKPHLPFVAPEKYWDLYDPAQIPLPAIEQLPEGAPKFVGHVNGELHSYAGVPKENPIPADFARTLRHGYYACISYTDAQIGKLLDALDRAGVAENTIIVVWGDHGWQLGDHGLWHKHTNFEIATRAPLLISAPGMKVAGQKCAAPVEFIDVYPTLAELCQLPAPINIDGRSLSSFIHDPSAPAVDVAISQYPRDADGVPVMGYSVRDARWRCTFWRERNGEKIVATELYDELNDPHETVNVSAKPENAPIVAALAKNLPPIGSSSFVPKKKVAGTNGATPAASEDRNVRFDRLYPGKTELTLEEYLAKQSDTELAKERFRRFDTNNDGNVTRDEFVRAGKTPN